MSLFNTLDFWCTRCGDNETFGFNSMAVADLEDSGQNKIIVASFSGFVRIYQITVNETNEKPAPFKPSDLLLETQLSNCIIQIAVGKLVSGSKYNHLCIVHPRSISVHSLVEIVGSTEHGNQYELKMIYEQPLLHTIYEVIVAPFGGVTGRDFMCAVAADGTLSFFEQETFVSETQLPSFLLPSPVVYVPETDVFVTLNADWCIEAYSYQSLVKPIKKTISTLWSYNLGESLLGIRSIKLQNNREEVMVIILSDHHLTCLNSKGFVKFVKRFDYTPLCFHPYDNDNNDTLMTLVVSDASILFVYEKCTLRWSSKLPILPICIIRANLGISGSILLLSQNGELNSCYLGTAPSLFVAPPLAQSVTNYKNKNKTLEKLQNEIRNYKNDKGDLLPFTSNNEEISISLKFIPHVKSIQPSNLKIEINISHPITNVYIQLEYPKSFKMEPSYYNFRSLIEKTVVESFIIVEDNKETIPNNMVIGVTTFYTHEDLPHFFRKETSIPPHFVLQTGTISEITDDGNIELKIHCNTSPPKLTILFQEFIDEEWSANGCNDDMLSFCLNHNANEKCEIKLLESNYFQLTSTSIPMIHLIFVILTKKLEKIAKEITKNNGLNNLKIKFKDTLPLNWLQAAVFKYIETENLSREKKELLGKFSSQYRLIQRRLLVKYKDKMPSNLTLIQMLYQHTYDQLMNTIKQVNEYEKEIVNKSFQLQSTLDLLFDVMLFVDNIVPTNVNKLKKATKFSSSVNGNQGWAEKTLANVIYLLRTSLSMTARDQHRVLPPPDKKIIDSNELVEVLFTAINRILGVSPNSNHISSIKNVEQSRVSPIPEVDENEDTPLQQKKFHYRKNEKLLKKRRPDLFFEIQENI